MDILFLALLWMAWCTLHSALISVTVTGMIEKRFRSFAVYHRLVFNGVSAVTFAALLTFTRSLDGPVLFQWHGAWWLLKAAMLAGAVFFFKAGSSQYDMGRFLGIHQIRSGKATEALDRNGGFVTDGILRQTRHPWYAGTFLFLWSWFHTLRLPMFIALIVLTGYVFIGTRLEEKKLILRYGDAYRNYQATVPMFFPRLSRIIKRSRPKD